MLPCLQLQIQSHVGLVACADNRNPRSEIVSLSLFLDLSSPPRACCPAQRPRPRVRDRDAELVPTVSTVSTAFDSLSPSLSLSLSSCSCCGACLCSSHYHHHQNHLGAVRGGYHRQRPPQHTTLSFFAPPPHRLLPQYTLFLFGTSPAMSHV